MSTPARTQSLTERPAWRALSAHVNETGTIHLKHLFATDPDRGERLTLSAADLFLDYSKNRITDRTLELLVQLDQECDLGGRIVRTASPDHVRTGNGGQP